MTTQESAYAEIESLIMDFKDMPAHAEIVSLVEKMLSLQKERQSVRREEDLDRVRSLERQIQSVDEEIDRRVYVLYELTEEEFRIIEGK
jgi:hypothetical protein